MKSYQEIMRARYRGVRIDEWDADIFVRPFNLAELSAFAIAAKTADDPENNKKVRDAAARDMAVLLAGCLSMTADGDKPPFDSAERTADALMADFKAAALVSARARGAGGDSENESPLE